MRDEIAALRRFNRAWSQRLGVLDDSFLGSGRPLGPSRVLFEIGPGGVGVRELRERLGLDAGYLSRLLRGLEREGLVATVSDATDARRRLATLTAEGLAAWRELEERSDEIAERIVAPLSPARRTQLADALRLADGLVRSATAELVEVDPASERARAALAAYFAELDARFPGGFEPGIQDPDDYRPPRGRFVLALSDGEVVACGALQRLAGQETADPTGDTATAEVKRMWVHPAWRGWGLAGRMLRHLEGLAAADGFRAVRLDTNPTLVEAIAMYRGSGYREIERYNDNPYAGHWFEKALG